MNNIVYDKICVMCPTRGRADTKLPVFIQSLLDATADLKNVCASFVVNESDTASPEVIKDMCQGRIDYEILVEDTEECDLAHYFNLSYKNTKFNDPATCVSMFGDDMVFVTKGWDKLVLEKINGIFGIGFIYGDDDFAQHDELCVYLVTTRAFVEMTGKPFMCPLFAVDYIDNVWMEVGRKLNCAVYLPNLHIRHDHATKSGKPDGVWLNMRKQYELSHSCMIKIDDYANEIAVNVKKVLAEKYLSDDISYCMTTYDRIPLFSQTVTSWNKSLLLPEKLFVFDDFSKNVSKVAHEIRRMKNAVFVPAEKHCGCDKRNALAVTYFDTPAVMVIDSDTAFAPHWCIAANIAWNKIKDRKDIAGVTVFNTHCHERVDEKGDIFGLNLKVNVGGFGTVYKKKIIDEAFGGKDIVKMPVTWSWDNFICDIVKKQNGKFCGTPVSYLQHTGFVEGTHTSDGELSDYAGDFIGKIEDPREKNVAPASRGSNILFAAMARVGDIIAASMIANMLIEKGMALTWVVIRKNEMLVRRVCPWAKVISVEPIVGGPMGDWSEMTTRQMRERFAGYQIYINAQLGSRENHNYYLMSGKHPCIWIRDFCSQSLGIPLENNFTSYLRFNEKSVALTSRDAIIPENLAIIAPHAKTAPVLTPEKVEEIYDNLKGKGYNPKILIEKRPERKSIRDIREKYIFGLSLEQCIVLIRKAKHFVGQDSGLAWCSLFSKCSKRIYHRRSRIDKVNTYFETIDERAEDIILEDK